MADDEYSEPGPGFCLFCDTERNDIMMNLRTEEEACVECWAAHVEGFASRRGVGAVAVAGEVIEPEAMEVVVDTSNWLHDAMSKEEANALMEEHGLDDGRFFVRARGEEYPDQYVPYLSFYVIFPFILSHNYFESDSECRLY